MSNIKILLAQMNPSVGNIALNLKKISEIINQHQYCHDLIIFPEFAITGYPIEDLIFKEQLKIQITNAIHTIQTITKNCHVIVGNPEFKDNKIYNAASIFYNSKKIATYHKQALPNYSVFDECRYFSAGTDGPGMFEIKDNKFALIICEDLWHPETIKVIQQEPIDALICINASPYYTGKLSERHRIGMQRLNELMHKNSKLIYVNMIGGQDELVFDGQSFILNSHGDTLFQAEAFIEKSYSLTLNTKYPISKPIDIIAEKYLALKTALKDFIKKNNLQEVTLGLSGGIDSAVTLSLAVDVLGAENVHGVIMPSRYNAASSAEDALLQAERLNVKVTTLPIENLYKEYINTLTDIDKNLKSITLENLQARIRGTLLMAISNQFGSLVLSTSNKSETAVGYCTLYGDMSGGFAPLKDVLKTEVYQLAHYINRNKEIIPQRVITRPPSAELAPDQTDQDNLPPYDILDPIINAILEHKIVEFTAKNQNIDQKIINKVVKLVKNSEFKRHQAPPGPKITKHAFGKDWRLPISGSDLEFGY